MIPCKVVTLLEILRSYAQVYVQGSYALGLISTQISTAQRDGIDVRKDADFLDSLHRHLRILSGECLHLPMTGIAIAKLVAVIENRPNSMATWTDPYVNLLTYIADVQNRLIDELSLNLFFKLPTEKKKHYEHPSDGWEEIIARFPDSAIDVEEMNRCFALSRYAAAVFHSVSAIEVGLLYLGKFLSVHDPHSGWTAVCKRLQQIIDTKYDNLNTFEKTNRPFIEQMHAVAQALKSAWRNKISHAQGKLLVMTSDFSPDVAEEIMMASRSFMRRLATEMPREHV